MTTIANVTVGPHDDPLSRMLEPVPNETAEHRAERAATEALARQISNEIDEYLKKEAHKRKDLVKLLLLGAYRCFQEPLILLTYSSRR